MRLILSSMLLLSLSNLVAQIADVDFSKYREPQEVHAIGHFKGVLPVNMRQDFTSWSAGVCETESATDTLGDQYLRFHLKKGGTQFNVQLPKLQNNTNYKVTIVVRNQLTDSAQAYLRQAQAPYKTLGPNFAIPQSDKFLTLAYPFRVDNVSQENPPGLYMHFGQTGTIDFKRIRVEEINQAEYDQMEMDLMSRVIRCPEGTANFLRHSCLPCGLQSGWTQLGGNNQCRSTVTVDKDTIGPSGEPTLLLDSTGDANVAIASEPFASSNPLKEITVSFSVRGTGKCHAAVRTGSWMTLGTKYFTPNTDSWQRVSLTVKIPIRKLAATLQICCEGGKINVDAFRVGEKGETEYKTTYPHEINLYLPESDASISRIQFTDEPDMVRFHATGKGNIKVKLEATDLYGQRRTLAHIGDNNGGCQYANGAIGQFRIEAQAFDSDSGQPVSAIHELVVTRIPRPLYWGKDAPASPFGIHMNQLETSMRALKAGGFNWMRFHDGARHLSCWYYLERQKGKWTFRDKEIQAYRDNHIMLYGQLGGAPRWATDLKNLPDKFDNQYPSVYFTPEPQYEGDYANYCETMTRRYKGVIDDWFIWNEPWGALFFHKTQNPQTKEYIDWGSKEETAKYYTKLSKITYEAAKRGNPNCRISGFNSYSGAFAWNKTVYDEGGYSACDEIDYHNYFNSGNSGFPNDDIDDRLFKSFDRIIEKEGKLTKPYIMSEGQANSASTDETEPRTGLLKHSLTWPSIENYENIADANVRFMIAHLANGVKRVFFYSAHCYGDLSRGSGLQVMLAADGYPHPALVAMSALALRIEDRAFVKYEKLADDLYAAVFSDGQRTTLAFTSRGIVKATISCALRGSVISDLWGNAVKELAFRGRVGYITANCPPQTLLNALNVH